MLRGSEIAEFLVPSYGFENILSEIRFSAVIIRVTSEEEETMVHVQVRRVTPGGLVGFSNVLDSDRPGNEAARFCWRTLKGKKNLWL